MALTGEAVQEMADRFRSPMILPAQSAVDDMPQIIVAPDDWKQIIPAKPAEAAPLKVRTLAAVREYVTQNPDAFAGKLLVSVDAPHAVSVRGKLEEESEQFRRQLYMAANYLTPEHRFGSFIPCEELVIWLRSAFVQTDARDSLVSLVSSITESNVRATGDDGLAQQVTVTQGIKFQGLAPLPGTVELVPFRTFTEVEQPASTFVLRARSGVQGEAGPRLALIEADGGVWQRIASERLADWLRTNIPNAMVIS